MILIPSICSWLWGLFVWWLVGGGPDLDLIIYDGSLRGEFYQGDYLEFQGDRVLVQTERNEYEALLVTLRDNIKLLVDKR